MGTSVLHLKSEIKNNFCIIHLVTTGHYYLKTVQFVWTKMGKTHDNLLLEDEVSHQKYPVYDYQFDF